MLIIQKLILAKNQKIMLILLEKNINAKNKELIIAKNINTKKE